MEEKRLGAYRLIEEIGSGGMATVYLAEAAEAQPHVPTGERVAVKVLHRHLVTEKNFAERFRREAEAGIRLDHRNVVRTLDFGMSETDEGKGHPYLVMEYVEGQNLRSLLEELVRIPEDLCRHIGREVATALKAIHAEGIIHRDIKPENILITRDNVVKVMDLGVAYLADARIRLSATGQFVGSVFYAAPEQMQGGGKDLDHRVDLYQLGLLLYELASGTHPYKSKNIRESIRRLLSEDPRPLSQRNPQISPFLEEIVRTLMAKNRDDRFLNAEHVAEVLEQGEGSTWWRMRADEIRIRTRRPLRRIRIPRETALYGREEELSKVQFLWEKAKAGTGQALLVMGEAGIGKTRLVDEFHEGLVRENGDVNFLFGAYRPGKATTAEGAFSVAYREHFGAENLEDTLIGHITSAPLLIPAFAALLRGDTPPAGQEPLTIESVETVFVEVTRSLARERPTVVLLEDLHLAQQEALRLFRVMSRAFRKDRVLLIGTSRPGLPEDWVEEFERDDHARRIWLPRLRDRDVRRLMRDALGSERLAEALHARIASKSDGKPFYIFEILRSLREGQFIDRKADGTYVTTREIRELKIPSTVKDLVMNRITELEKVDRRVLEMAACCGFEFDPEILGEALGIGRVPLMKRLGLLERGRGLVRSVGPRFAFDDHPVQETLYDALSTATRRRFHGAIARALEMREAAERKDPREVTGAVAVELCQHYLAAGQPEKAVRYFYAALNHLTKGYQNAAAVRLMRQALASEDVLTGPRRIEVLLRQSTHLDLLGWQKEEKEALTEALALSDREGSPLLRARSRRRFGGYYRRVSEYGRARELLQEAIEISREAGDRRQEASASAELGLVAWREGRHPEARELQTAAIRIAGALGDPLAEAYHRGNLGTIEAALGNFDKARALHEEFVEFARSVGDRRSEALHTGYLADAWWSLGEYALSLECHEKALAISRSIGDRRGEALGYLYFGLLFPELGRVRQAREHLEEARTVFQETAFKLGEAATARGLGVVAEAEGRFDEAERLYVESLETRREIGHRIGAAESLLDLGRLHGLMDRPGAATKELVEAQGLGRELDWPQSIVLAIGYLALMSRGDVRYARQVLAEQGRRLSVHARLEANFLLFRVAQEDGYLEEARRLLGELLDRAPANCRISMCDDVPLHRDILAAAGF